MKKIVRRVKIVEYECEICGSQYRNKKDAKECEKRILETKQFKKGDWVILRGKIYCSSCSPSGLKKFGGQIKRIVGPVPSDMEYELKWLGSKPERVNGHVFTYLIKLFCTGGCSSSPGELAVYSPEIELANKPSTKNKAVN